MQEIDSIYYMSHEKHFHNWRKLCERAIGLQKLFFLTYLHSIRKLVGKIW